jgi:hypothetical protein
VLQNEIDGDQLVAELVGKPAFVGLGRLDDIHGCSGTDRSIQEE